MNEPDIDGPSLREVLVDLARRPVDHLVRRWNWKSAVLSSVVRSAIFFAANLGAGLDAARAALLTELVFRGTTAGFYGALTQALRRARPVWAGTAGAMVLLPLSTHLLELIVHASRGTVRLAESIGASVAFTAVSTAFNLFAMRHGALIVGEDADSLWRDLRRVPGLLAAFVVAACRLVRR